MIAAFCRWVMQWRCTLLGHAIEWPEGYRKRVILHCARCGETFYVHELRRR